MTSDVITSQSALAHCVKTHHFLPNNSWLNQFRTEQFQEFLQRGLPTRKEEAWKYTDISSLNLPTRMGKIITNVQVEKLKDIYKITDTVFVFVNGHFNSDLSRIPNFSQNDMVICPLSQAIATHESILKNHLTRDFDAKCFPFAKLNSALMTDGLFIHVSKNTKLTSPIYLLFLNTAQNDYFTHPRNIIHIEENSEICLIEDHMSQSAENYFTNVVTDMRLEKNSRVEYYKLQDESHSAHHFATILVDQKQDSHLKTYSFSVGARLARDDLYLWQRAKGIESELYGLYDLKQDKQHIDHHIHVDHLAEHGKSSMLYKGILDKKSQAVFNGKVHVHPNAQAINAHQSNHNLLLSPNAEIYTKPELEIYADDVKCTHGATVGQLDDEALFYLCSRGIESQEAFKLLTQAFAEEIYSKVEDTKIREYLRKRMTSHGN